MRRARRGLRRGALGELVAKGLTTRQIAERVGLSQSTVRHWLAAPRSAATARSRRERLPRRRGERPGSTAVRCTVTARLRSGSSHAASTAVSSAARRRVATAPARQADRRRDEAGGRCCAVRLRPLRRRAALPPPRRRGRRRSAAAARLNALARGCASRGRQVRAPVLQLPCRGGGGYRQRRLRPLPSHRCSERSAGSSIGRALALLRRGCGFESHPRSFARTPAERSAARQRLHRLGAAASPGCSSAQRPQRLGPARVGGLGQQPPHRQPDPARGLEAPRQRHADARPAQRGPRSRPCRPRPGRPPPARRSPARGPPCRARRGRPPRRSAASCARRTPSRRAARSAAPGSGRRRAGAGSWSPAPAPARPASPSSAARSSSCSGSCDGARRHQHERVVARRQLHLAERLLPQQRAGHAHARRAASGRGYSSWGKVATSASSREIPPCACSSGASPTRSRAPFSSRRPRSSPADEQRAQRAPQPGAQRACAAAPRPTE